MGNMRDYLSRELPQKVYPNPADPEIAAEIARGLSDFKNNYLGRACPAVLNGFHRNAVGYYRTYDPNDSAIVVGEFSKFSRSDLQKLVSLHVPKIRQAGRRFFQETTWLDRVNLLFTISRVVKERFWLLCAAKMYETGQSIAEAIGETDEEVDFPKANAMYLEEHHKELLIASPSWAGDVNGKRYVPHGVFLNVSPFNFPGAIPMDMATKALAMGNAIIEKSSPKASLNGFLVWESIKMAFERMGIAWHGVVNYFPGDKEIVNAFLSHPEIVGLSFTGSSSVLNKIKKDHGNLLRYGWAGRAKLITGSAETSGVNTFIVCADADVEKAAQEYVKSFVGRSGQKCSSARIGFVHNDIYDNFISEATKCMDNLRYGDVKNGTDLGALITIKDREKLERQIGKLLEERAIEVAYRKNIETKYSESDFPPTLLKAEIGNPKQNTTIMNTEFFGPVSTVVKFKGVEEVEKMCELTDFALTGSIFTKNAEMLRNVLRFIPAGNVYWNRKCTGALVEVECFGGLRSASSPNGVKGKGALLLFGSQNTFSGFYDKNMPESEKILARHVLEKDGYVLSKF